VGNTLLRKKQGRVCGEREFSELIFQARLPYGNRAQVYGIGRVTQENTSMGREACIVEDIPQENMGIQQQLHKSSGRGGMVFLNP
jgi:hypothetical protein